MKDDNFLTGSAAVITGVEDLKTRDMGVASWRLQFPNRSALLCVFLQGRFPIPNVKKIQSNGQRLHWRLKL